jgi:hypothetical protein
LLAKLEPTRVEPLIELHINSRLEALPIKIRLGWKSMPVANTLAYYGTETITAIKYSVACTIKLFRLVVFAVS